MASGMDEFCSADCKPKLTLQIKGTTEQKFKTA
jgi:hypothetical protein